MAERDNDETHELFEKYNDEYLKFELVSNKESKRPDLCAFIILDNLFQSDSDMVSGSSHDEIYLDITDEQANTIPENIIADLVRCGVSHNNEGLWMFS